jgi:hypothetical protein
MLDTFIAAIHARQKLRVTFFSQKDRQVIVRTCAPVDYSPSTHARDQRNRFHFWDYEGHPRAHPLPLRAEYIRSIEPLPETFDPAEFVTWTPDWKVPRDW